MNLLVAFLGTIASAAVGFAVAELLKYLLKILKDKKWVYFVVAGIFAVVFLFLYSSSPHFRDTIKAYTTATKIERQCFFEARITNPGGADSRSGVHAFPTPSDNKISWSPSDCVMAIEAYKDNDPIMKLRNKNPEEVEVQEVMQGNVGEIEIKIFAEGFETATHSVWIEVEAQQ